MRFFSKYTAFAVAALKRALRHSGGLIGSAFMLSVLVVVFSQLWMVIGRHYDLSAYGFSINNIIWYVAMTELITVTAVRIEKIIDNDIRSGDLVYTLTRPVSYFIMKQSEALGQVVLRFPLFAFVSLCTAFLFTGQPMIQPQFLLPAFAFSLGAILILHLCYSLIGFSAFWLQEATAPYLVFSKLVFVLGGIWLPMEFYPDWLREIAQNTPFTAILYAPAHFTLAPTWDSAIFWGVRIIFWIVVLLLANLYAMHKANKSLCVNGG